jgi:AraC-like DNA-binding protein
VRFREVVRPGHSQVLGAGRIAVHAAGSGDRDFGAYALVYIIAGAGTYADARMAQRPVAAGDAVFVFPGLRHSYGPEPGGSWSECWVAGTGPLFAQLEAEGLLDRARPVLRPGLDAGLVARFDAVAEAVDRGGGESDRLLLARVHTLCAEVVELADRVAGAGLVERTRAALAADLRAPVDLAALARSLGVSYDHLRRTFLREVGVPPGRWRTLRRIELVKERLAAGDGLEAIAQALGYCDRFFLARQFRTVVGAPPMAWRRAFLGLARR